MSDPQNRDPSHDDRFRNRIAAALRELDLPESDADIAAALDAIESEPLSEITVQRIMRQTRQAIAAEHAGAADSSSDANQHDEVVRATVMVFNDGAHLSPPGSRPAHASNARSLNHQAPFAAERFRAERPGSATHFFLVAGCAALVLLVSAFIFKADDGTTSLAARPPKGPQARPGELISTADLPVRNAAESRPASRPSQALNAHSVRAVDEGNVADRTVADRAVASRVRVGETLTTGPREKRRVTLLDGSVLSINANSKVLVDGPRRVKLLAGEVFVEVVPATQSQKLGPATFSEQAAERFVVTTPHRTVTALGTKFVVKAQDRATNVVVTQGKVQVSGVEEVIPAGQELIADLTESSQSELRPAKRSAYVLEWVKDLMASAGAVLVPTSTHAGGSVTVVDPQGQEMKLSLRKFHVDVHIEDGFARTTIDQTYFNHTWQQLEGTFRFPLPADASLSRLAMYVNGKLMEGGMVERNHGRNVFEEIRHTRRDPALLEWVDGSTFQMRVFPLEARQEKRILMSYTQRLSNDYGKTVYVFPSGHSLDGVREWSTHLHVKGAAGTKWYSPSHLLNARDDKQDLVLEGRDEYAALDRDLVVELGQEARAVDPQVDVRWSHSEQDGFRYLMLRQRPDLKVDTQRQPRQWLFLVENSADRSDVLASTQRQIVKVLIENAEHSDTFSIIRAGTQIDEFHRKPVHCTAENIDSAQQFLSEVAPIGALDLERALRTLPPHTRSNRDVWIVHLGTGIPVLGERDSSSLQKLIPANAKYVGVAVGKRWSKSFMETAAARTGGHVTQINPDEAVAWRAFDLLSTLNAPRLTEISVTSSTAGSLNWLLLTNSLAHGQELAAATRVPRDQSLPERLTITGKLNGRPYSKTVALPSTEKLSGDAAVCGHLPRTWARLEIDRLVALGAEEHKAPITELSKAMYVMSPFTSLLVLETEAMYAQYKVDRGRKDHWAMYPAPEQIPVVTDAGPAQLTPLDAAKERLKESQARAKTAQSNYERGVTDQRPAGDIQRLQRLTRVEQAEVERIEREIRRIEQLNAATEDPIRKAWDSVIVRRSSWIRPMSARNRTHWRWVPNNWEDGILSVHGNAIDLFAVDDFRSVPSQFFGRPVLKGLATTFGDLSVPSFDYTDFGTINLANVNGTLRAGFVPQGQSVSRKYFDQSARHRFWFDDTSFSTRTEWLTESRFGLPAIVARHDGLLRSIGAIDFEGWDIDADMDFVVDDVLDGVLEGEMNDMLLTLAIPSNGGDSFAADRRPHLNRLYRRTGRGGIAARPTLGLQGLWSGLRSSGGTGRYDISRDQYLNEYVSDYGLGLLTPSILVAMDGNAEDSLFDSSGFIVPQTVGLRPRLDVADGYFINGNVTHWNNGKAYILFNPNVVAPENGLPGVIKDLPSYAPGLQTWHADRLAIAEQANKTKPTVGEVDAEAKRLIEKARSLGWQKVRLAVVRTPQPVATNRVPSPSAIVDGAGRFVLDREVSEGLKERVVHDGSTLWQLYPEIGLGAKRTLSRFHQSAIQSLIPWYVPAIEHLSVQADVKSMGSRTVRITALKPAVDPKAATPKEAAAQPHQYALELVFADEGRLTEIRVLDLTDSKVLAKQTFDADGTVRVFDRDNKLVSEVQYEVQAVDAPNLVPDTKDLVVLPLPYRSAQGVPVSVPVNLETNAPDYAKLSDDEALQLLATYFAEGRAAELSSFLEQRFTNRGDQRLGLAVLAASVIPQNVIVTAAAQKHPNSPLANFLTQFAGFPASGNLSGTLDAGESAGPFLKRVCSAYNHFARWQTDRATTTERPLADIQNELTSTLNFISDCRSIDLAARLLNTVHLALQRTNRMNPALARQLSESVSKMAAARGVPSFGRNQQIEWLLTIGEAPTIEQAVQSFRTQLLEEIEVGMVPTLRPEIRAAFVKQSGLKEHQSCVLWGQSIQFAADKLVALKEPHALVTLARRCVTLNESDLAGKLFQQAVNNQDLKKDVVLNLAALAYAKEVGNWQLAEECVERSMANESDKKQSSTCREAADIKFRLHKFAEWIELLDRAYEIEFSELPKTVNLAEFRKEYDTLFSHFDSRTAQLADAKSSEKLEFARRVQRAAARWRDIDVDHTAACHRTAKILTALKLTSAAWNYWTSPLAETPESSSVWQTFASAMQSEQRFVVADQAWSTAFACEPTNPEILVSHAQFLRTARQEHRAVELLRKVTTGEWQPRFAPTKQQAEKLLNESNPAK